LKKNECLSIVYGRSKDISLTLGTPKIYKVNPLGQTSTSKSKNQWLDPFCNRLSEQVKRLEAFFKQKVVSPNNDDRDDNSFGKYYEFLSPRGVKHWSIELDPMIGWINFVHKFRNTSVALSISYEEHVKDVLFEKGGILYIHCKTMEAKPYMFTLCMEYCKFPFHLPSFLKSLENSKYEYLMKEIKE
jgi:hypothetical protein